MCNCLVDVDVMILSVRNSLFLVDKSHVQKKKKEKKIPVESLT